MPAHKVKHGGGSFQISFSKGATYVHERSWNWGRVKGFEFPRKQRKDAILCLHLLCRFHNPNDRIGSARVCLEADYRGGSLEEAVYTVQKQNSTISTEAFICSFFELEDVPNDSPYLWNNIR